MKTTLTANERRILHEQYNKVVEQIDAQGFVNQLLGAETIHCMVNLALERLGRKNI